MSEPITSKLAEWRGYESSDFDGLEWPVQEFALAARLVGRLHAFVAEVVDEETFRYGYDLADLRRDAAKLLAEIAAA